MRNYLVPIVKGVIAFSFSGTLLLRYLYQTQLEGVVKLKNAPGTATITREEEN